MDNFLTAYLQKIDQEIDKIDFGKHPIELYAPITYIMSLGGKRLRPLLTMLSYRIFCQDIDKILKPALAVEVFHNFTLMHDDIMDKAPLRRGKATVHEKWSTSVAILSGDVMLVRAYDLLLNIDPAILPEVLRIFNKCAAEVCEGQQLDMNFETTYRVSEADYIEMIRLKTAVLLGLSLELGALIAGASARSSSLLRQFGEKIGIGFQLKDDLLDVYANKEKFGKQIGGDIISNKKTYLLIKALEKSGNENDKLNYWLSAKDFDKEEKVAAVKSIYNDLGVKTDTELKMNAYFTEGFKALENINEGDVEIIGWLRDFAKNLIDRES
ncbi:MAG: polyprenyl synthetase family protein [Cyclobacteriaceae bacterium]